MSFVESLERRQFFAAGGSPVASFGLGGLATVPFRSDVADDVAAPVKLLVDKGGRSYVVAYAGGALQVKRVAQSGQIDATYANARGLIGLPTANLYKAGTHSFAGAGGYDAAIDSADRLYVLAGTTIYRFTTSGKIDPTYGVKGAVTLSGFAGARAITVGAGDKLYVCGSLPAGTGTDENGQANQPLYRFAVARLRTAGKLDKTFVGNGIYADPLPAKTTDASARGDFIQTMADGSVVAAAGLHYGYDSSTDGHFDYTGGVAVSFAGDGLNPAYGPSHNGRATSVASSGDILFSTERLVQLRSDGLIIFDLQSISDDPNDEGRQSFVTIAANGRPGSEYAGLSPYNSHTFRQQDGSQLVTGGNTVHKLNAAGVEDSTFVLPAYTHPVDVLATQAPDTSVLTAGNAFRPLSINVRRVFNDARVVADLSAKPLIAAGSYSFAVTYQSAAGFATASADGREVGLFGPNDSFIRPTVAGQSVADGVLTVRYTLTNDGSPFTSGDNGPHTLGTSDTLKDRDGNTIAFLSPDQFLVAIA